MIFHSQPLRKKPRATALLFAASLAFAALADAKQLLHNIQLQWRPTAKVAAASLPAAGIAVQIGKFGDQRDHKELIGENREEADEGTVLPVSTVTDVPGWVGANLASVLRQNGMNVVDNGAAVTLDGDVQRFFVAETNNYQADVALHLRARDAAGNVLWETTLSASDLRFGRSYKKENYEEALSNALVSLAQALLNNAKFRDALAGASAGGSTPVDNGPTATDPLVE